MTVKVERYDYGPGKRGWSVTCNVCSQPGESGAGFLGLLGMNPWVRCQAWPDAQVIAVWHKRLHDERRCGTCDHEPALPRPELIKDRLFSWEGTLRQIINGRVCEMHPTEGAA